MAKAIAIPFPLCFSCFVPLRRFRENLTKPFYFYLSRTCDSPGDTPSAISLALIALIWYANTINIVNWIHVILRTPNARSPCFLSMKLVQLWLKLRPPFVPCPNVPLQCFILHMMLMKYQRWKWVEHSTVVVRDSCYNSIGLVQLKQASDHTLLIQCRYSIDASNLTIIVKMQYLFSTTLCHTTNKLIRAFIVRFVHALKACEFPVLFSKDFLSV